jgi:hypothetical protein
MSLPTWIVIGAFIVFLGMYLGNARVHGGMRAGISRGFRRPTATVRQLAITWIFTMVALPVVLLEAHATWLERGVAFLVFVALLAAATAFYRPGDR